MASGSACPNKNSGYVHDSRSEQRRWFEMVGGHSGCCVFSAM